MEHVSRVIDMFAAKSLDNREIGDYLDTTGLLMCGKCHTRKQTKIDWPIGGGLFEKRTLGCACKCEEKAYNDARQADTERAFKERLDELRRDGITDPAYLRHTFVADDGKNQDATLACRRYVDNWPKMLEENIGILLYGDVGTGKSFFAGCIANALLEKLITVSMTNFPRLLNALQGSFGEDKQVVINKLQRYALLVIDDLGAERDTAYSTEQIFNVIDTRSRARKPLIVTTNLTLGDLKNPQKIEYKRIYDRVLDMCPIRIKLAGKSRRGNFSDGRAALVRQIIGTEPDRRNP